MYERLLNKIIEYKKITIYRHARPDGDCVFSSLAIYYFLKDNFKDKSIKLCGKDKFDLISKNDVVSDKFIKESLAIILDTATLERVDDERCANANYIIKIDHHPAVENYGDLNIVKPQTSSTCQIIAEIFMSKSFSKYKISDKIYEYLYCGIVTDTLNFKTANTTYSTLQVASKLIKYGNLKPSNLVEYLTNVDLNTYSKITNLRNKLIVKKNFGYIKLDKKTLKTIGLEPVEAKNQIDTIGNIKELNIWALAVENNGGWDCSLRSKRSYVINSFASKYRGGGHANACAVKKISSKELDMLFNELIEFSSKKH